MKSAQPDVLACSFIFACNRFDNPALLHRKFSRRPIGQYDLAHMLKLIHFGGMAKASSPNRAPKPIEFSDLL